MCLSPIKLDDGTEVACRSCKLCKDNRIKDWSGRLIAESKTSAHTYFVGLTYGRDEYGDSNHIRAAVLTYSDVQKYFKRVRKIVGKFKYFVVGEYGAEKGRAHWHVVLFTQKPLDEHVRYYERYMQPPWDHGWSYFEPFHYTQARYCCKYLWKDQQDDIKSVIFNMSKKPPLGDAYFRRLAQQYVAQGLAPQDLFYRFAEIKKKDGKPVEFLMRDTTAENFLTYFVFLWQRRYGKSVYEFEDVAEGRILKMSGVTHLPQSELVEEFLDKQCEKWGDKLELERRLKEIRERKRVLGLVLSFSPRVARWDCKWDADQEKWVEK